MKITALIMLPIGLVFISYFVLIKEMNKPSTYVEAKFVKDKCDCNKPPVNYNHPTYSD
jgi:hypothetical protein